MFLPLEDTMCCSTASRHYDPYPLSNENYSLFSLKNPSVSLPYSVRSKFKILSSKAGQDENEALWVQILGYSSPSAVPLNQSKKTSLLTFPYSICKGKAMIE